jgi:hypothetical protein
VQTRKSHATLVVKPHHHLASLGVDAGVVRGGDAVAVSAAGDNGNEASYPILRMS